MYGADELGKPAVVAAPRVKSSVAAHELGVVYAVAEVEAAVVVQVEEEQVVQWSRKME